MSTASHGLPGTPAPSRTAPPITVPGPVPLAGPRSLDDLAALRPDALAHLYRAARTPAVPELDGDLVGRMLAVPVLPRWMFGALRRFAAWTSFPWRGKSFRARDGARGDGINRVFGDTRRWFRFETSVGPSRAGGFDAFQLDYDNPDNPRPVRAIRDELREVAPGLYLGLAYLMSRERPRLILYFGLARP
jgi:hypothetical protein